MKFYDLTPVLAYGGARYLRWYGHGGGALMGYMNRLTEACGRQWQPLRNSLERLYDEVPGITWT